MAPSDSASSDVAIGIDLGTTYSCVAVYRDGKATVIQSKEGHLTHPSYVAFTETERLVGHGAKNQAAMNPKNTIYNAKRLIGRCFSDEIVQDDAKLWPFTIRQGTKDKPTIIVQHKNEEKKFIAEEISAMVLTKMKEIAEEFLDCEINKAVVTVPAYFNDSQRQCTKDAGKIAGLDVIAILSEPTAAAIAYGVDKEAEKREAKNVLVFDLGGGTFDVSLVTIDGKDYQVHGTAGDTHLGGEDFDDKMVEHCVKEFEKKHKIAIGHNPRALRRLRTACEKTKIELSTRKSTTVEVDGLEGKDFSCKINRAKFEMMNKELFEKCMIPVQNCLADAKMDNQKDVHELLLVGGSSRIPRVQELLREFFGGKDLSKTINPDEAVACGAAIHAFNLCCPISDDNSEDKPLVLRDVIPLSLGLELGKERKMGVLIPKNKSIPTEETKAYSTYRDNQDHVSIKVYQGEKELVKDNHFLGEFKLTEIPPAPKGTPKIDVCFAIDTNGILKVSAEVEAAGKRNEIKIENISMLGEEEINEFKKKNERYKSQDVENNKTMEMKNKLEEYVLEVKGKLIAEEEKEWVCKLRPDKKIEIDDSIEYFEKWLEDNTEAELDKYENLMDILMRIFDNMMKKKEGEDEHDTMTPEEAKNWKCIMHPEKRLKPGFTGEPDIKDLFI